MPLTFAWTYSHTQSKYHSHFPNGRTRYVYTNCKIFCLAVYTCVHINIMIKLHKILLKLSFSIIFSRKVWETLVLLLIHTIVVYYKYFKMKLSSVIISLYIFHVYPWVCVEEAAYILFTCIIFYIIIVSKIFGKCI